MNDDLSTLEAALSKLELLYAEPFRLHLAGVPNYEIAPLLGITIAQVAERILLAKGRLYQILGSATPAPNLDVDDIVESDAAMDRYEGQAQAAMSKWMSQRHQQDCDDLIAIEIVVDKLYCRVPARSTVSPRRGPVLTGPQMSCRSALRRSLEIGGHEDGARIPLRAGRDLDEVGDGIHADGFGGLDEAVHGRGDDSAARGLGPEVIATPDHGPA